MRLVSCLLLERRVLVHSKHTAMLAVACETALSLLCPFTWSHTYIPLLCRTLLPYLNAPFPFLIGLNSAFLGEASEYIEGGEVVIVDLDAGEVTMPAGPAPLLPVSEAELAELVEVRRRVLFPEFDDFTRLDVRSPPYRDSRGSIRFALPRLPELSVTTTHEEAAMEAAKLTDGGGDELRFRVSSRTLSAASANESPSTLSKLVEAPIRGTSEEPASAADADAGVGAQVASDDACGGEGGAGSGAGSGSGAQAHSDDDGRGEGGGGCGAGAGDAGGDCEGGSDASEDAVDSVDSVAVPVEPASRDDCAELRVFFMQPLLRLFTAYVCTRTGRATGRGRVELTCAMPCATCHLPRAVPQVSLVFRLTPRRGGSV